MRRARFFTLAATLFLLAGCATIRYRWSLAHAYMSSRAQKLPRAELEEIVWLVSHAWSDAIIAVGGSCSEGRIRCMSLQDIPTTKLWSSI